MVAFLKLQWHKKELASELLLLQPVQPLCVVPRDNAGCLPGEGMASRGSKKARFEPDDDNYYTVFLENIFGELSSPIDGKQLLWAAITAKGREY